MNTYLLIYLIGIPCCFPVSYMIAHKGGNHKYGYSLMDFSVESFMCLFWPILIIALIARKLLKD